MCTCEGTRINYRSASASIVCAVLAVWICCVVHVSCAVAFNTHSFFFVVSVPWNVAVRVICMRQSTLVRIFARVSVYLCLRVYAGRNW